MAVVQLIAMDSQSILQRVFVELVRRKVEIEDACIHREEGLVTMIMSISNFQTKESVIQALMALQDVVSVEWVTEDVECRWERSAEGSKMTIFRNGQEVDANRALSEYCLYMGYLTVGE